MATSTATASPTKPTKENPTSLPVALVIGASRGIGRQLALSLATHPTAPYYVVVSSKTTSTIHPSPNWTAPDPNSSQSTINTVAHEINLAGGHALPVACDVRDTTAVTQLVHSTVARLGRLDVLIYNSGAIWWSSISNTPPVRTHVGSKLSGVLCCRARCFALPLVQPHTARTNQMTPI